MTRGHNIDADGWAGAFNPDPHLNSQPTHKHTQKVSKTLVFSLFDSIITDGQTDQQTNEPTDLRTDRASYRVACPQLKRKRQREKKEKKETRLDTRPISSCWRVARGSNAVGRGRMGQGGGCYVAGQGHYYHFRPNFHVTILSSFLPTDTPSYSRLASD